MGLKGKVCIITGGGSGIGRASALMMAEEGAVVVAVGRTYSKVEQVRDEVAASGGTAEAYGVDVGDKEAVDNMVNDVLSKYGKVDVLVNNAGHSSPHRMLMTTTPEDIRSVMDSNLSGSVFCSQAVVPSMKEAGEGTIINVSSMAGVSASPLAGDELQRGEVRRHQLHRVSERRIEKHGHTGERGDSGRSGYAYPG